MNADRIEGNWKQLKGSFKQHWGRMTNDQFIAMEGKRDQMAGKDQESYGRSMDEAVKNKASWQAYRK